MAPRSVGEGALVAALLLLLAAALVYPLLQILSVAALDGGRPTLGPILAALARPLLREALANTLLAGALAVAIGSAIAVPLALLSARCRFPGRALIGALAVLPLAIPPFVGALGFQQILGPRGTVNLLLGEYCGVTVPFMEGLAGVVLVQSLHYFPLLLLNTAAALGSLDRSLEEAARSLGASGFSLFRRVVLPLALPGYIAGALLIFVRVIDDLGTPLVLDYPTLLAPQVYARVTTKGLADVDAHVICLILLVLSLGAVALATRALGRAAAAARRREEDTPPVPLGARGRVAAWGLAALLLGPALLPHAGIVLLSISRGWSVSPLPTAYTAANYREVLVDSPRLVANTLGYAGLAALGDVALGAMIAWLLLRGRVRARRWLDPLSTLPLAVPGVVIAVGYLRAFGGAGATPGEPLASTWLMLVAVYAVRRLPYTVRGAHAALGPLPPALEEAARTLGAGRARTFRRILLPLMARGLLAGGLLALVASAVDLSSTLLLVPRPELGPLSYGFYRDIQSAGGRGPAAALGVVAIGLVAAGGGAAIVLARRSAAAWYRS